MQVPNRRPITLLTPRRLRIGRYCETKAWRAASTDNPLPLHVKDRETRVNIFVEVSGFEGQPRLNQS